MDDKQTRKYNAAVAGEKELTLRAGDFTADVPLNAKHAALISTIGKIDAENLKQMRNKGFATKELNDLKKMADDGWVLRNLLVEYAKEIGDEVLLHAIDFGKADLNNGTIANRKNNAQTIYDNANVKVGAMVLAGYNITPLQVAGLQTDINKVTADEGLPKTDIAETKAATEAMAKEFGFLKDEEESITNLMVPYAGTNPDFYNEVTDAFEPSDIGIRHIALRLVASDSVTNARLGGAELVLDNGVTKKSSKRGIIDFSHQELPEGNYAGTVKLSRYVDFAFANQGVFDDKFTRVVVGMVKV